MKFTFLSQLSLSIYMCLQGSPLLSIARHRENINQREREREREMSSRGDGSGSSRWCPTQEQVVILEEMYRGGIRTPNASQIQHITSQLSFYGKIEGKNVFYWFQNHKARDRQKLRRRLNKQLQLQKQQQHHQLCNYYVHHLNHSHNHHLYSHCPMESLLSSSSSSLPRSFYHSLAPIPEQGGAGEASKQGMDYVWGVENTEGGEMEQTWKEDYWRRTRMEGSPASADSYWPTTRNLKTLELFPIMDRIKQV